MDLERIRDFWPDDPRWGEGYLPPSVGDTDPLSKAWAVSRFIRKSKELVRQFEEKYPEHHWWTPDFVTEHPAISLLMQAVNKDLIFPVQANIVTLSEIVSGQNEAGILVQGENLDVFTARLGLTSLLQNPEGGSELSLLHQIMTDTDRLELAMLLNGHSRFEIAMNQAS